MTIKFSNVFDAAWTGADRTAIECRVQFDHLPDPVPFTASPVDTDAHGRELYARLVAGDFGAVSSPASPSDDELANTARATRDALLRESDWSQLPDVPQEIRVAWAAYRTALRDLTEQPGWPTSIAWPQKPQ